MMRWTETVVTVLLWALTFLPHGTWSQTVGQTVVSLEGGTATFRNVPIPGTGGTTFTTADGRPMIELDFFGSRVGDSFRSRLNVTNTNSNGFRGGSVSFVLRNVQRRDAGTFLCQSQFEGLQTCGNTTLVVAGPPTTPTISVLNDPVIAGNDVIMECQSTSTSVPATAALQLVYNLKENGRLALRQPTPAFRFKLSKIAKTKTGARYQCVAYENNTLTGQLTGLASPDSQPYAMNVLYPADTLIFNPPKASYVVSSGDDIADVTCSADCNPTCTIDWYKDSQIFQSGPTLVLGKAETVDGGNYFCRAKNSIDTVDAPLTITVSDKVDKPTLKPSKTEYAEPEGTTIEDIVCSAQCTPACSYEWQKAGQPVSSGPTLRLGAVTTDSGGTYTCLASNGQDSTQVSLTLDVLYPPKTPPGRGLLSPSTASYTVEEGALVLPDITCAADCNPACTVQWTKRGGQAPGPGSTLSLGAASRDDTGSYTCTIGNILGQVTADVAVNIEYGPEQISLSPADTAYKSVENFDVLPDIRCAAMCTPDCQYSWFKDDGATPVSRSAALSLGTADRAYTGTFQCVASNKLGRAQTRLTIDVLYGPTQTTLDPPQDGYTLPSGASIPSVTCSADCNPTCTYKWVKDDSSAPVSTSRTLTLGQAEPSTAGIYKCLASNDYGSANAKFDLDVQFGPSSTIQLQPPINAHNLSEGDDLTVSCSATCDPACNFRWKDNSVSPVSGDGTLQLRDVRRENGGTYTCVADNGVGTPAERSITVNVLIGPRGRITITPPDPVITLKLGNSVVFTCTAECSPTCSYKWLKGTQELTSSNGILTLNDVNKDQDGAYTCEASNSVERDRKDAVLEIQYGPGNSITFDPNRTSHPVEERSDLTVRCQADCKPVCDILWQRGQVELSRGDVLQLNDIGREQAGAYTCTANNAVNQPSTAQIMVDVLYGPGEVRVFPDDPQLYPVQGSSVSLKCWAECNPECGYTWYRGSLLLPDAQDGELDLRNVTREESGIYLCVADNGVASPASRTVEINVRAGPGTTIRFNPPDDTAMVVEGKQFQVECIAECSPACVYEWRKGPTVVSRQSALQFAVTDRKNTGSYICFASNDANSQASKPLTLDVQYGPGDSIALFPPGQNQSYAEGSPFSIKCSAVCEPECQYQWFLGPSLLAYTDGVLFSDSARQDQAGTYTCSAANQVGSAATVSVTVDVQTGPGKTITFTPPGDTQVVKEGEDLRVRCSADCSPTCSYTWVLGSDRIPTTGGVLELRAVDRQQKGMYSCLADNGLGSQGTKLLTVDVQYGPEGVVGVFPDDSTQVLNEGGSVSLKCSADCSPECSYTWFLGNDVVTSVDGELSLVAVGPEDAGTYRCSAENSIGLSSSDVVTVIVQTGPGNTVRIEPEGDIYNVTEGEQLRMRCSAVCSPPCTYTWYYGYERVKSPDGSLILNGVLRNSSGPFVCYAANDVGLQGSRLVQVDVLYGPVDGIALDPPSSVSVVAGNPFTLRCSANCHPPCDYEWFQGPQAKMSEGGKLDVRKATEAEGGSYTCRAVNGVGSAVSEPVMVEVQYGPRDTIRLDPRGPTYVVREGDDVTVTCSADCKPQCTYSWFAGSKMVSPDGQLTIPSFQRDMPQFFTCFADNGLGSRDTTTLEVVVHYGPGENPSLFPDTSPLTATLGGSLAVQCAAHCSPQCSYIWTRDGEMVFTPTPGVLQLQQLTPDDGGTYICVADNGIGPATASSVQVELLTGPSGSIRFIPPGLSASVEEGGTVQVTCQADCAPQCNFSWTKGEQQVSSSGVLRLSDTQRSQQGVYQCRATNDVGVDVTQQLDVTVQYGPSGSVKLFPPEETRNLNRGDTFIVQCSALCWPPCTYRWRKDQQQLATGEGVLLVPNVTSSDKAQYTCTADNGVGMAESLAVTLNVNFGPEDSVKFDPPTDNMSVSEGETLEVRCSADCLPACTYTWYLASRRLDTGGDGRLMIEDLTRADAGTYTCHADNGVGRRRVRELRVDVEFPPSVPTFDPATTSYTIRERLDSVLDIRCSADCNPRCQLQWLKDGSPLATLGSVLSLTTPDRSADGVYACVANNKHGRRQKDLTVHVNYAPSIAVFTINDRKTVATVPEKYPVTLNCRVSSKPPSTIQLFNGSRLVQERTKTLQAKFAWKQAECLDAGVYACTADNGVGTLVSVTAQLKVLCQPRLDPRIFQQPYVAGKQGQTAVITVPVLADPAPSFLWYKIRDGVPSIILEGSNDTQGHSDKFFTVNGTSSTLTIENVQLADFGDYVVRLANERGSNNFTFSLVPQSAPYQARNLTARPINSETVEVTWSPGFNGGDKQVFYLEYLKEGTSGWRTLRLDPRIEDVARSINVKVSDLNPSTLYTVRLRSRNAHGWSNFSHTAQVVTDDAGDQPVIAGDVNPTPVLLGVGLALGFLVGAGITAIVVVSKCRPKTRKRGENTIDDFRSDTTYDTLYLRDALWAQRHIKMRQNSGSFRGLDGYDYKQPEDTVRGYNDYTSSLKPVGEMRTSL